MRKESCPQNAHLAQLHSCNLLALLKGQYMLFQFLLELYNILFALYKQIAELQTNFYFKVKGM